MVRIVHNNYITIAKAIGIILMVVGHSGCSDALYRFIYLFHMPLFFFCSGIFMKNLSDKENITLYLKRRIKGLYISFVKWSLFFLLLHNILMLVGVYNSYYGFEGGASYYSFKDTIIKALFILFTMHDYEELQGGFWFIRALFVSSILIVVFSLLLKSVSKYKYEILCVFFLIITIVIRRFAPDPEFWRDISMGALGAFFYMTGYVLMRYKGCWQNKYGTILCCFILFLSYFYFKTPVSMGCGFNKVLLYSIAAVAGILLTLNVSNVINYSSSFLKRPLFFVGNHTLEILALHFLMFRVVSYLYLLGYDMDVSHIAEHPVIASIHTPSYMWIVYSIVGVCAPIVLVIFYLFICNSFKKID